MTMLTSLKALLFPTVAPGGAQAIALPAEGSVDFAQFLGAAQADKPASPPAADDVAAFAARTSATLVGQEYSHGGDKAMAPRHACSLGRRRRRGATGALADARAGGSARTN